MVREPDFGESQNVEVMGDPHVVYLRYRLVPANAEFRAPPIDIDNEDFSIHVGPAGEGVPGPFAATATRPAGVESDQPPSAPDTEAVFTFKKHHPSERAARDAVRSFLEAWELDDALRVPGRPPRFEFELAGSLIVDRAPPPGRDATYVVAGDSNFYVSPTHEAAVVDQIPQPPAGFVAEARTRTLWSRWEPYLKREDTLPAAAYACLTYIETEFGPGGRDAADRLRVSRKLLRRINELTSRIGDESTARKFDLTPRRAHTPEEIAFLEAAVTLLIRRVGGGRRSRRSNDSSAPRRERRSDPVAWNGSDGTIQTIDFSQLIDLMRTEVGSAEEKARLDPNRPMPEPQLHLARGGGSKSWS